MANPSSGKTIKKPYRSFSKPVKITWANFFSISLRACVRLSDEFIYIKEGLGPVLGLIGV